MVVWCEWWCGVSGGVGVRARVMCDYIALHSATYLLIR